MRKFMSCLALGGLVAVFGCNTATDHTDEAAVPNVAGEWSMTANTSYLFSLNLSQTEDIVGGFMERTNGVEPIDAISGTIDADGHIVFTRARVNQVYSGTLASNATSRILEGTFTAPPATNQYSWRATLP